MVRLPQAKDPKAQTLFRQIREMLPHLFSDEEHRRYLQLLHALDFEHLFGSLYKETPDIKCRYRDCTGHDADKFYGQLAEAIIGRVLMWIWDPDVLKNELVRLLKSIEHAAVLHVTEMDSPMPQEIAAMRDKFRSERLAGQRI
jgi:hypothetical protein